MARFVKPSGRSNSRGGSRGSGRGGDRRDVQRTKVICSKCGVECEVPFKPTSNKPVYCDACFGKNDSGHNDHNAPSVVPSRELDIINEKLNKIMKALDIE